jgi:rhomboid protease GluP
MITILLIALNLIVYGLMLFSGVPFLEPTAQHILQWGGCNSATILHGESWRLLSAMFVHFGILHLLMNIYALYDLGLTLEKIIGKTRFLMIYLATGIFGGLVSQVWHLDTFSVEAGASGGVFGVIGVLIALLTTRMFPEEVRIPYLKRVLGMVAVNLVYGLQASVNMAAHMGGLVSGFILGYGLYLTLVHEKQIIKQAAFFLIPLVTLFSVSGTLKYMKGSDYIKFDEIASEIEFLLGQDDKIRDEIPSNEKELSLYIKTVMLPVWEQKQRLAAQARNLTLSGQKAKYRDYLETWIDLNTRKLQAVALKIEALERHEDIRLYQNMIKVLDDQLAQLVP